jgi:hypothetical protein
VIVSGSGLVRPAFEANRAWRAGAYGGQPRQCIRDEAEDERQKDPVSSLDGLGFRRRAGELKNSEGP